MKLDYKMSYAWLLLQNQSIFHPGSADKSLLCISNLFVTCVCKDYGFSFGSLHSRFGIQGAKIRIEFSNLIFFIKNNKNWQKLKNYETKS